MAQVKKDYLPLNNQPKPIFMKQSLLMGLCAALASQAFAASSASGIPAGRVAKQPYHVEASMDQAPVKRLVRAERFNNVVNPIMPKRQQKAVNADLSEVAFSESFEGNRGQLPEGWAIESYGSENLSDIHKWVISPAWSAWMPGPSDGDYYARIIFSQDQQDEWIISPQFELGDAGYELNFMAFMNQGMFYVIDRDHVDYNNEKWIKQEICNTFQVLAQEEGGEWEVVKDYAEDGMGIEYSKFVDKQPTTMEPYMVSMEKYAGKKIRLAFRVLGHDGNTILLDQISVSLPEPEAVMAADYRTMYYGFSNEPNWPAPNRRVAVYPAYSPITFTNMSYDNVIYSWMYQDPATGDMVADNAPDYLEVTYKPDFDPNTGTAASFVAPPVLVAEGTGYKSIQNPWADVDMMQIGGAPSLTLSNGIIKDYTLFPFEQLTYDIGFYSIDCDPIGKMAVPAFGYNGDTDEYWLWHHTQGDPEEGDYCHLTGYYNMIYPGASPLVVEGATAFAYGLIGDDAEFKCEIYPYEEVYDEEGDLLGHIISANPLTSATCKGTDVINRDPTMNSGLTLPFVFDHKVIIDDTYPAYCVKITGFHSDKVKFFAPIQQWKPDPNYLCLGWIEKEMCIQGREGKAQHGLGYYANEFGDMYCSFAIGLSAYYPWLESDVKEVNLGNGTTTEIVLDSYNDASDLEIESSPWIKAAATGRFHNTRVSLVAETNSDEEREGFVTVKADGQSKTFKVKQAQSGINDAIAGGNATVKAVYNLDGTEVHGNLPAGMYIEVYTDGSARKRIVK